MSNVCLPLAVSILLLGVSPAVATTLTQLNVPVIENFDTLAASGTTNSTLPAGWSFAESGSGANTTYAAATGSSTTGNTYSFGATSSDERAFGTLRTGSLISTLGTSVTNETDATITSLQISYVGEQWRLGALDRVDRLDFSFSIDATSLTTGSWIDVDPLDFVAPVTTGTTGALNGNLEANQSLITYTLTGLALTPGTTLWLRWHDFAAAGPNDGLGIDDVSITAFGTLVPNEPPPASVPDGMPLAAVAVFLFGLLRAGSVVRKRERAI